MSTFWLLSVSGFFISCVNVLLFLFCISESLKCNPLFYFQSLLGGEFKEATQPTVPLSNVEGCVVEPILNYAYTNEINITESNVYDILHAADYLQVILRLKYCSFFFLFFSEAYPWSRHLTLNRSFSSQNPWCYTTQPWTPPWRHNFIVLFILK